MVPKLTGREYEMGELCEEPNVGLAGPAFTRLLVVVDDSEEGREAVDFAGAWCQATGATARILELHAAGPPKARNRSLVRATVSASTAFEADVIVVGCPKRRLARHRMGPSLRQRLARATDLPLLVLNTAHSELAQERGTEGAARPPLHDAVSTSYARV